MIRHGGYPVKPVNVQFWDCQLWCHWCLHHICHPFCKCCTKRPHAQHGMLVLHLNQVRCDDPSTNGIKFSIKSTKSTTCPACKCPVEESWLMLTGVPSCAVFWRVDWYPKGWRLFATPLTMETTVKTRYPMASCWNFFMEQTHRSRFSRSSSWCVKPSTLKSKRLVAPWSHKWLSGNTRTQWNHQGPSAFGTRCDYIWMLDKLFK